MTLISQRLLLVFLFLYPVISQAANFDFNTEAPSNFKSPLDIAGTPNVGASQNVASTQGDVNVANGAAKYSVNIELPPAVRNLKPSLALSYNSQANNGVMGVGWQLAGLSAISRCRPSFASEGVNAQDPDVRYSINDRLCLDGQKLVVASTTTAVSDSTYWATGTEYRTEIDSFTKIVSYGSSAGGGHGYFKVWTKDGRILTFGAENNAQNSKMYAPNQSGGGVSSWALDKVEDNYGNNYIVTYTRDIAKGEFYPAQIMLGNTGLVVFSYDTRLGKTPWGYDSGQQYQSSKVLSKVTTYVGTNQSQPIKQYDIRYKVSADTQRDLVDKIYDCGYVAGSWACTKPVVFDWQAGAVGFDAPKDLTLCAGNTGSLPAYNLHAPNVFAIDIDGDGFTDLVWPQPSITVSGRADSLEYGYWGVARGTKDGCFNIQYINSGRGTGQLYSNPGSATNPGLPGYAQPIKLDKGYGLLAVDMTRAGSGMASWPSANVYVINVTNWSDPWNNTKVTPIFKPAYNADGDHSFVSPIATITVGDFNNDGRDDFYFNRSANTSLARFWIRKDTPWVDNGVNFIEPNSVSVMNSNTTIKPQITAGDFNGDGMLDLQARTDTGVSILLNNASGQLVTEPSRRLLPAGDGESEMETFNLQYSSNISIAGTCSVLGCVHYRGSGSKTTYVYHSYNFNGSSIDVNGDGLPDYVVRVTDPGKTTGTWRIYINTGNDYAAPIDTGISTGTQKNQLAFQMDYNKDGLVDLVTQNAQGTGWQVLLSTSTNVSGQMVPGFTVLNVDPFQGVFNSLLNFSLSTLKSPLSGDIDNKGGIDYAYGVVNGNTTTWKILASKNTTPDLIVKVTDGFNAETSVEYGFLNNDANNGSPLYTENTSVPNHPQTTALRSISVVKKLSVSNGAGSINSRYFNYTGAKLDVQGRGSLGFENIQTTDAATGVVTSTDYRQDWPFTGKINRQLVKDTTGKLISITNNGYAIHPQNTRFPYLQYSLQKNYQLTGISENSPISVSKAINAFDSCGNLIDQTTKTGSGFSGVDVSGEQANQHIVNVYNNYGTTDCTDDFLSSSTKEFSKAGGANLKRVVTEFIPNAQRDVQTRTDFKGESIQLTTTYGREANGAINSISEVGKDITGADKPARTTTYSNFAYGIYPQQITNAEGHVTALTYDYRFGKPKTETFIGLTTTSDYDYLGRLIRTTAPDGTSTESISFYCSSAPVTCPGNAYYGVATQVTNANIAGKLGEPLSIVFYDLLQREVRNVSYRLGGKVVNKATEYQANGYLSRVSEPYATNSLVADTSLATNWTTYSNYNALGQANSIASADGGAKTTSYLSDSLGLKVTENILVIKPYSGAETQTSNRYINALGQIVKVEDALSNTVAYGYDAMGNLEATQVNNNTATAIALTYDVAGNKTYIKDPDAGIINFDYDGYGELRRQTWRKDTSQQKYITFDYDKLGRKISQVDQPANGASSIAYSWLWDTKQQGQLSSRTGNGFSEEYFYDGYSRLSRQVATTSGLVGGEFSYAYDNFSRSTVMTYPGGFKIQRDYHAAGYQVQTRDITNSASPKVIWALGDTLDARGNFNNQLWGNGVVTQTGYDNKSGRLNSIKSGRLGGANTFANLYGDIQNLSYGYDTLGNLTSRTTARTNSSGVAQENLTETFFYDKLNRIKNSTTSGLFSRTQTYDYDTGGLGNLVSRNDFLSGSSVNNDVGVLKYEQVRNAGVHAVTSANGVTYSYDTYGNMVNRGSDTIEYDTFNKPTKITGSSTTQFFYDSDRELYKETSSVANTTTYRLAGGAYEVIVNGFNNGMTQKSYVDGVVINNRVVFGSSEVANDTFYLHSDHLGSIETTSNALGQFVNRMSFSTWGERQDSDWTPGVPSEGFVTSNGYTGHHQVDAHKLVHMGGRVYDPELGRFLSADLYVQSPYGSQGFNRYSYGANNPLSTVDPTGYCHNASIIYDEEGNEIPSYDAVPCEDAFSNLSQWIESAKSFLMKSNNYSDNTYAQNVALCQGGAGAACTAAVDQGRIEHPESAASQVPDMGETLVDFAQTVHDIVSMRNPLGFTKIALREMSRAKSTPEKQQRWKVGDNIYQKTAQGKDPAWSTVRARFWKNEAASADASKKYSEENLARMRRGGAPQRYNQDKGGQESMDLSHEPIPARDGGTSIVPRWPQDHAAVDPFRRPGY